MHNPNPVKLKCRNIWKVYGDQPDQFFPNPNGSLDNVDQVFQAIRDSGHIGAACNVSFDVHEGEIFVIMGLSGSGKSTMIRCLSRLVEPTVGEVFFDGEDVLKFSEEALIDFRRHKMGMVFQGFGLLPHLTVLENIAFPLKIQGMEEGERLARAEEVIDLVELTGREQSFPHQLSGGQQQRVGIARSLVVEPQIWFLDEPFSALDPLIRRQMQDEFLRLQRKLHKTIVFITHDFLEALRISDRIAIMKDGKVVQIGTPTELVLNPADDYVREFTRDVPRVRVITAGEVARSEPSTDDTMPVVDGHDTLEDIMPLVSDHPEGLRVKRDGQIIGIVSASDIVNALAKESTKESQ